MEEAMAKPQLQVEEEVIFRRRTASPEDYCINQGRFRRCSRKPVLDAMCNGVTVHCCTEKQCKELAAKTVMEKAYELARELALLARNSKTRNKNVKEMVSLVKVYRRATRRIKRSGRKLPPTGVFPEIRRMCKEL
jgi:hypothetical protein